MENDDDLLDFSNEIDSWKKTLDNTIIEKKIVAGEHNKIVLDTWYDMN